MEFKEIILEEIKERLALGKGFKDWGDCKAKAETAIFVHLCFLANSEALDKIDRLYKWASVNGWTIFPDGNWHETDHSPFGLSDSELYDIFKEQEFWTAY